MNYYVAAPNGNASSGYLVTNGQVFEAVSGSSSLLSTPEGQYTVGNPETVAGETSLYEGRPDNYRKFRLVGVGESDAGTEPNGRPRVTDPRDPRGYRTGILIHFDGGPAGTAGCIGYKNNAARYALEESLARGDNALRVIHVKDAAEAKAMAEMLKNPVGDFNLDRSRMVASAGEVTQIENGARQIEGERSVLAGPNFRRVAHVGAVHSGGAPIDEGRPDILVGRAQLPISGVGHRTRDNSRLGSGEPSVLV